MYLLITAIWSMAELEWFVNEDQKKELLGPDDDSMKP